MKTLTLFLMILILFCSQSVFAENVTSYFSGIVTSTAANSVAISEVQIGDKVEGQYSFDSNSVDGMAVDNNSGLYAAETLSLTVNGYTYSAADNNISVTNNTVFIPGQPAMDAYEVVSPLRNVSGPSLSGLPIAQIDLVVVDTDATVFSDDSLPVSLDINEFEITSEEPYGTTGGRIVFQSLTTGGIGEIRFEITELSTETQSVPQIAPDIKANGSDSAITVSSGSPVSITIALDEGDKTGQNADWWLVANTPFGWYHYDAGFGSWIPDLVNLGATYQGPLISLSSPFEILSISGLPIGTYAFYFGVDMNMNGSLDSDQLYFDWVMVDVTH
jgi:uncharacterized protein YaiE (UPF0345 family)